MVKIRLNKTDSIKSSNKENSLDVNLMVTSKIAKYNNVKETIDSYEIYKEERKKCNRYRLILTINPFCTNVLFNPLTEIAKYTADNGGVKIERVIDTTKVNGIDGETSKRVQYIANTIYSNSENGYVYYPGYDIFDNHILRSKGFSVINNNQGKGNKETVFNTLSDFARNSDGEIISIFKRSGGVMSKPKQVKKHTYNYDMIMSYVDSVNYNLSEQDGWLGFPNVTKLKTYYKTKKKGNEIPTNWNCVLNNYNAGEFIQMYPDRSTYSFVPYYNTFLNRLEYNWDIIITYPYENVYEHNLIRFKGNSALKVFSATRQTGLTGEDIIMFRMTMKHNLKRNDYVRIMWEGKNDNFEQYRVTNIGNLKDGSEEYYFYIDDPSLVSEYNGSIENIYMQKIVNGIPSEYYFRKFKKFDYNGKILAKEQYNLGFATTIYNDETTQITFTDTLDFTGLVDNLGRPVCEFYITILKANRGNKEWYTTDNPILSKGNITEKIEVSHCFTKLTDGLDTFSERLESDANIKKQRSLSNIRFIGGDNHKWLSQGEIVLDPETNNELGDDWVNWHGITKEQDWFYGDVVEFVPSEYKEYVIANVNYRFNTYQRENIDNIEKNVIYDPVLVYHEIASDDYDFDADFALKDVAVYEGSGTIIQQTSRDEGYYYNPHYPIRMKDEGEVIQGSHYTIRVRNVNVIQSEDVRLKIVSYQNSNVNNGDVIILMDDKNAKMFDFRVVYVETGNVFYIMPVNGWFGENGFIEETARIYKDNKPLAWTDVAELLRRGENLFLRRKNPEIPSYAVLVDRNIFLWRNYYNNGELNSSQLPEYVFANNAFYVTPIINFFVKRQDPNGYFGLYTPEEQNPQDIAGETKKSSNYSYKDTETIVTC